MENVGAEALRYKVLCVENMGCGKHGAWKTRGMQNAGYAKCGIWITPVSGGKLKILFVNKYLPYQWLWSKFPQRHSSVSKLRREKV